MKEVDEMHNTQMGQWRQQCAKKIACAWDCCWVSCGSEVQYL
jgi:hypothetical protein